MKNIMQIVGNITTKAPSLYDAITKTMGYTIEEWESLPKLKRKELIKQNYK